MPKRARRPQDVDAVPFKEIRPLALKNRVSGKRDKAERVACLEEMSLVFSCLKKNDFDQAKCLEESKKLQSCFKNFRELEKQRNEEEKSESVIPGKTILNARQLNMFLKRFPTPK